MVEFEQKSSRDRSGQIGGFNYHFHGAGCRLEKNGIVWEFNFMPTNEYPIKFCLWKMSEFVIPNKAYGIGKLEESELHEVLKLGVEVNESWRIISPANKIEKGRFKTNICINFTKHQFHIRRATVNIFADPFKREVTYTLFEGDGFWDADFIDAKYYQGPQAVPGGKGSYLERGGVPYDYNPTIITIPFY